MNNRNISAVISLIICFASSAALIVLIFTMPSFFKWFYYMLRGNTVYAEAVIKTVVRAFYFCVPFAAAALFSLIRLLFNVRKDNTFISVNVLYIRIISYCCYFVMIVTAVFGFRYFPLFVICFAMAVVGTLLSVMKNILQSAVEIKEENELTI